MEVLYVTDDEEGLRIIDVSDPSNPYRFSLPERSYVRLKVYDVLGRLVSVPLEGEFNVGQHEVSFKPKVKGVYFYRLETEKELKKGKFVVF